jgi:hypothetical protein
MAVISTFSEIMEARCEVKLHADQDPVMVHISVNGCRPLELNVFEAVAVREALGEALDLFLDEGDEEETVQ